ncbi:putative quinol monooxygenase [Spirosoma sp. KNUC1025]|uniref:putative quinol monooxygenase n=1 Tax=Spirosoma sp. KNUC1025 TaxID=2894082 RepID=UPI00386BA71B|nr:antibiotic biosynthesis monooxygenase [Spirosoma sp. KNUC1025]
MNSSEQIQNGDQQPVILFVRVAAKPESQQLARDALRADVLGARTEDGNIKMELYTVENEQDRFYLFERWQNQSALDNHFQQPYTQGAFDLQQDDLAEPIEMNYLEDVWPLSSKRQKQVHRPLTTLIVPFETKPGCSDAFVDLFKEFVPLVRNETGNVEFHFHKVIGSTNRFVLYERWETQQDLDAHNQLPTTATLLNRITPLLTRSVIEFVLVAKDIS